MAFDITNFTLDDIKETVGTSLENTSLANALNIQGSSSSLRQFYNRFGVNATFYADKSIFKLSKQYYFNVEFDFRPSDSKVRTLLANSLSTSDVNDTKYLIQSIEVPNIRSFRNEEFYMTELGKSSPAGIAVTPTDNQFTVSFLSTEYSIHEHTMYYWMRESTDGNWAYTSMPFSRANVTVRMLDSKTSEEIYGYKFYGVFPHEIETTNPNHNSDTPLTRNVIFNFDMMSVLPSQKTTSSVLDDIFDKYIGNSVGNLANRFSADIGSSLNI